MMFYSLKNGIFVLDNEGTWSFTDYNGSTGKMDNLRRSLKVWRLGNGSFTVMSLEPEKGYRWIVDRYYPDRKGNLTIEGVYPDFRASDGFKCWLDHDGCFLRVPIPLQERIYQRNADLKRSAAAMKIRKQRKRDERMIPIVRTIREGGYEWAVWQFGKIIGSDTNVGTRNQAMRDARRFIDLRTKGG